MLKLGPWDSRGVPIPPYFPISRQQRIPNMDDSTPDFVVWKRLRPRRARSVSGDRSCVHPFIRQVQAVLRRTGSVRASFDEIPTYRERARRIYRVDVYCIHAFAVSTVSLRSLVLYEYLRYRGVPLPDSRRLVGCIVHVENISDRMITGKLTDDKRHEAMSQEVRDAS